MIIIFSVVSDCPWTTLSSVVVNEGTELWHHPGTTLQQCMVACDEHSKNSSPGCRSIGYCPASEGCYLYDKELKGTEPLQTHRTDGCTTSFRPCHGNVNIIS